MLRMRCPHAEGGHLRKRDRQLWESPPLEALGAAVAPCAQSDGGRHGTSGGIDGDENQCQGERGSACGQEEEAD